MDRNWYIRFSIVVLAFVLSLGAIWPSVDHWVPAPEWVKTTFKGRLSPGLDIRGGMRLMYEVEVDEYIRDRRDRLAEQLLRQCGVLLGVISESDADRTTRDMLHQIEEKCSVQTVDRGADAIIRATIKDPGAGKVFHKEWLHDRFRELRVASGAGTASVELSMRKDILEDLRAGAVKQAVRTIEDRIDHLGLKEASVIGRQTDIIVEVPGAQDESEGRAGFNRIKDIISRTARLEFKIVDDPSDVTQFLSGALPEGFERRSENAPAGPNNTSAVSTYILAKGENARERLAELVSTLTIPEDHQVAIGLANDDEADDKAQAWRTYYLFRVAGVTGDDLDDAAVGFDQQEGNRPQVDFTLNRRGAERMGDLTRANIQRRMAIVLDDRVESAPVIQSEIGGGRGRITMGSSFADRQKVLQDAEDLVVVLQAGALPAPLRPANEQMIGPTLGEDAVRKGALGALVGIGLVLLFMAVYYEVAGLVADVMVVLNLITLLAIMATLEASITLPGIAAIALTVGMAVDANVLITERIREELRAGKSPRAAVEAGFDRAFSSIFDSQLTTAIAGIVLLQFGTGPIKGFATMLLIGIFTSLFSGVFCSKVMMEWIVRGLRVEKLRVG